MWLLDWRGLQQPGRWDWIFVGLIGFGPLYALALHEFFCCHWHGWPNDT
jgi:hypothetical protein